MARPKLTFREQIAGFPVGQILVICCARISEPIAFSSLFPYVFFLTRDFHVAKTEADISRYAGYLSAVFSFCSVISAIQWSKFSQRNGRKVTVMIGLCGSVFSMLLLGFSVNYYMALAARASIGLLNGNLPVLRTTIGEIATERRHQALAFSTFPLIWNIGCIFGPLIGSLAHPRQDDDFYRHSSMQIPGAFASTAIGRRLAGSSDMLVSAFPSLARLNASFPYALPNLIVSVLLVNSILVIFLFMEETHYSLKYRYDFGLDLGDRILVLLGVRDKDAKRPWLLQQDGRVAPLIEQSVRNHVDEDPFDYEQVLESEDELNSENDELVSSLSPSKSNLLQPQSYGATSSGRGSGTLSRTLSRTHSETQLGPFSRRQSITLVKTLSRASELARFEENDDTQIPWKALRNPMCYGPILANILLNVHVICYDQFIPLFLSTDVGYDANGKLDSHFPLRISGGLGFTTKQVGKLLSVTGFAGMLIIMFVYPYVDRTFKSTVVFTKLHYLLVFSYIITPYIVFALPENLHQYAPGEPKDFTVTTIALYALFFVRTLATDMLFPLVTLLTHVGAPPKHRAIINSLAISSSAAAKCMTPLVFGSIMSFGLSHHISWLFFWSLAFAALIGWFQSHQLVEDAEDESKIHPEQVDDA